MSTLKNDKIILNTLLSGINALFFSKLALAIEKKYLSKKLYNIADYLVNDEPESATEQLKNLKSQLKPETLIEYLSYVFEEIEDYDYDDLSNVAKASSAIYAEYSFDLLHYSIFLDEEMLTALVDLAELEDATEGLAYEVLMTYLNFFESQNYFSPTLKKIQKEMQYVDGVNKYLTGQVSMLPEKSQEDKDLFDYGILAKYLKKNDLNIIKSIETYLKTIGAAGTVAQSIEKEDLEPGVKKNKNKDLKRIESLEKGDITKAFGGQYTKTNKDGDIILYMVPPKHVAVSREGKRLTAGKRLGYKGVNISKPDAKWSLETVEGQAADLSQFSTVPQKPGMLEAASNFGKKIMDSAAKFFGAKPKQQQQPVQQQPVQQQPVQQQPIQQQPIQQQPIQQQPVQQQQPELVPQPTELTEEEKHKQKIERSSTFQPEIPEIKEKLAQLAGSDDLEDILNAGAELSHKVFLQTMQDLGISQIPGLERKFETELRVFDWGSYWIHGNLHSQEQIDLAQSLANAFVSGRSLQLPSLEEYVEQQLEKSNADKNTSESEKFRIQSLEDEIIPHLQTIEEQQKLIDMYTGNLEKYKQDYGEEFTQEQLDSGLLFAQALIDAANEQIAKLKKKQKENPMFEIFKQNYSHIKDSVDKYTRLYKVGQAAAERMREALGLPTNQPQKLTRSTNAKTEDILALLNSRLSGEEYVRPLVRGVSSWTSDISSINTPIQQFLGDPAISIQWTTQVERRQILMDWITTPELIKDKGMGNGYYEFVVLDSEDVPLQCRTEDAVVTYDRQQYKLSEPEHIRELLDALTKKVPNLYDQLGDVDQQLESIFAPKP